MVVARPLVHQIEVPYLAYCSLDEASAQAASLLLAASTEIERVAGVCLAAALLVAGAVPAAAQLVVVRAAVAAEQSPSQSATDRSASYLDGFLPIR